MHDGQTIVLGGLTDREHDVQSERHSAFCRAFRSSAASSAASRASTTETELFIFLTPRVIRTDEDAERLTDAAAQARGRRCEP